MGALRLAVVVAAVLAAAVPAAADPHPMSSGATPAPATETQVAMTAETLTIAMDLRSASVEAKVTLENRGEATKLVVGFPCAVGEDAGAIDVPCKIPLTITVGGKRVKAKKVKTSKTTHHWQWPMKLAASQQVELVVRYRAPLVNDRYSAPGLGMGLFTYRLTTGARWAGPIGDLRITVDHLHDALLYIAPAGYVREPGRLTWTLTDHEPTEEVIIIPHPFAGSSLASHLAGKGAAAARKRILAGDYERAPVQRALDTLARDRDSIESWLPTITRVAGTPTPPAARAEAVLRESTQILQQMADRARK